MPLDRLVLIIVLVLAAGGGTIWLGVTLSALFTLPFGWLALLPVGVAAFVLWRVVSDRLTNPEDDHYDRMRGQD